MGRFHALLPNKVAVEATMHQLNLPALEQTYRRSTIIPRPDLAAQLEMLWR